MMDINTMKATLPQVGKIEWIGLRPGKREEVKSVSETKVNIDSGLENDHYKGTSGNRQVTLIQHEHIKAVQSILRNVDAGPEKMRRNLVVSGINLFSLKEQKVGIGENVVLEITGECHPCSRMEENLGPGGYNAMRGHGGMTARVLRGGIIHVGDPVRMLGEL